MKILVISAHPDDEVLGCGGTIYNHSKSGDEVYILILSEGATAQYKDEKMIEVRREAAKKAAKILGAKEVIFENFPDTRMDTVALLEINRKIEAVLDKVRPDVVYTHCKDDMNVDHLRIFDSTLIACRPKKHKIKKIISYEIIGSTKQTFMPNFFVDIKDSFDKKLEAFKIYESEIEQYPKPRSLTSIETLARFRGIQAGLELAEAFFIVREVH